LRLLFVRPPKYLWPYMNEQDNYLLPQAIVYLGAEARRAGHQVTLLDCMPLKMGWKSLESAIRKLQPDLVLCGDSETLYAHESGRVFALAKSVNESIVTVAGGVHFSHAAQNAFSKYPIDAIIKGEGEITLIELLRALETGTSLEKVAGLILPTADGRLHDTGNRPLIEDLDTLPFPAYDLLPMDKYGTARYLFSPGGVTIHHSRGCINGCRYCACWLQMAQRKEGADGEKLLPRWRTRSVIPVVDEMEILARKYDKTCQVFVDDTWNADPRWCDEFADQLLRRGLGVNWFAFMRADFLDRDEKSGLFEKLIASGLAHICVGLERSDGLELQDLGKLNIEVDRVNALVPRLRRKFPSLFLQTTFIVGLRQDTPESLDRLSQYVEKLDPDYPAFHPITPVPGTSLWTEANEKGWLEITDFSKYDWMTPVMGTETMSRGALEYKLWEMNKRYMNPVRVLRGILSPHTYRRRMYLWWLQVSLRASWDYVLDRILPSRSVRRKASLSDYIGMIRPDWYEL
jgi:anaerobic magnesium-protoporphyrin IX monomethyl ester cyclase